MASLGDTIPISLWTTALMVTMGQLFDDGVALTFEALVDRYSLNNGQFLTHAAIFANIKKHWGS